MNILIMTNMFPPITTGSSQYAEDLAMILNKRGHNVTVVSVELNDSPLKYASYPFEIIRLPSIHVKLKGFNWFTLVSLNPINYWRVASIIKNHKIDVVHQVNHYLDTAIVTRVVCKLKKIPYVVSIHTQLQFAPKIYTPLVKLLDRLVPGHFILRGASKIIALDQEILRYLREAYGEWLERKIEMGEVPIIPHGIELNELRFPRKKSYELSSLIVSVGHVIEVRNRLNLIRAMKKVVEKFQNIKLEIIGRIYTDEPQKLVNKLGLEQNVYLVGEKSRTDTIKRLGEADLNAVWLNLEYVGMGTAVQESMLCGVPVINNSPENLYGDGKLKNMRDIVLIDHNNVEEIASKIILLLRDKELRRSIGENGRNYVINNLDNNLIVRRIEDTYLSATQKLKDRIERPFEVTQ